MKYPQKLTQKTAKVLYFVNSRADFATEQVTYYIRWPTTCLVCLVRRQRTQRKEVVDDLISSKKNQFCWYPATNPRSLNLESRTHLYNGSLRFHLPDAVTHPSSLITWGWGLSFFISSSSDSKSFLSFSVASSRVYKFTHKSKLSRRVHVIYYSL